MDRIRLTKRASRGRIADAATPQTAIDLGKNRTYHKIDEYHTFEQTVNHELPDMRHEWKDDKRGDANFGIPKYAKVYMAAKKATKLATLLLGSNASEASVEKQARAFMRMGDRALTASLNIYAECKGGDCEEPATTCVNACEEPTTTCYNADDEEEKETPVVETEDTEAEEAAPAAEGEEAAPAAEGEAETEEAPAAEGEAEEEADIEVDEAPADGNEISFDDDTVDGPAEADDELSGVFDDDDEANEEGAEEAPEGAATTRKAGVKKLAGQPTLTRVASKKADELSALWDKWSQPDVR